MKKRTRERSWVDCGTPDGRRAHSELSAAFENATNNNNNSKRNNKNTNSGYKEKEEEEEEDKALKRMGKGKEKY